MLVVELDVDGATVVPGEVVVVGGTVVVVVDVVDVVVVVALMIELPNVLTCDVNHAARVLYPLTVRWTPSAMNRDAPFGTK